MRRAAFLTLALGGLSACATTTAPPIQAINADSIGRVQTEIKRQIGVYSARAAAAYKGEKESKDTQPARWCGNGQIDYDISSVTIDLVTTVDDTAKAGGSASIPVVTAVTVGPSISGSHEINNTQELTYNQWPLPDGAQPDLSALASDPKPAPLADVLLALRKAMISNSLKTNGSTQQMCLIDFNPANPQNDPGNTFKLALTITDDGTAGVNVGLGIVSLSASNDSKQTVGNTITVHFKQSNISSSSPATPCPNRPGMISLDGGKTCTMVGVESFTERKLILPNL